MPQIQFVIPELPPDTPTGTLFLTGDHRDWVSDPAGWTFEPQGGGAALSANVAEGSLLGVKVRILRPDGQVVEEGDAWGGRAPAHKAVISGDCLANGGVVQLPLAGWQDERCGKGRPQQSAPPREELTLSAPWGQQWVRIWSPENAAGPLPLLIMHDGQNVFDEAPTFAGQSWDVAGAASRGKKCRIVALSVNEERSRRYVPFPFEMNDFNSGADEYLDWIGQVLKPALVQRFGTVTPTQTALAGSSFGGLITLYAGLRDPQAYGTLGVFSPAIFPADFELLRWMVGRTAPHSRVWLDMGDHEAGSLTEAAEVVQLTHDLAAQLRPKVQEVKLTIGAGHWHDEQAWRERFPDFLAWWLGGLLAPEWATASAPAPPLHAGHLRPRAKPRSGPLL